MTYKNIRDMKGEAKKEIKAQAAIQDFNGYFAFLNNDYLSWVYYDGLLYPSVAVAFQAARTMNPSLRLKLSQVNDYDQFARLAQNICNPEGWVSRRNCIMEQLVRDKFKRNKQLCAKLLATNSRTLINGFSDGGPIECYWGVVQGVGSNHLGKLLMSIRAEIVAQTDSIKWVLQQGLEADKELFPTTHLVVEKDNETIDKLFLESKSSFMFGSIPKSDFKLDHPSISKNHACIYFSANLEVVLVDMHSTHGTKIKRGGETISLSALTPLALAHGDAICFGLSTRKYVVSIDLANAHKYMARKQSQLQHSIAQAQLLDQTNDSQQIKSIIGLTAKNCLFIHDIDTTLSYHSLRDTLTSIAPIKLYKFFINQRSGRFQGKALVSYQSNITLQQITDLKHQFHFSIQIIDQVQAQRIIFENTNQNNKKNNLRSSSKEKRKTKQRQKQRYRLSQKQKQKQKQGQREGLRQRKKQEQGYNQRQKQKQRQRQTQKQRQKYRQRSRSRQKNKKRKESRSRSKERKHKHRR